MTTDAKLWQPSPERIAQANITEFTRRAARVSGRSLPDYASLWRWSTDEREAFWREVWDFAGVVGTRGERTLLDPTLMPGARWFPDARLNFAENLLTRRAADDTGDSLVFRGEDRLVRRVSHAELVATTSRVAAALKRLRRRRGRSRRGVRSEHAGSDRSDAGRDEPGRGVVVVLAGFRRPGGARPLRPDRAARALHRGWLLVQRQAAADPRQGGRHRRPAADGRAGGRDPVPRGHGARSAGPHAPSAAPSRWDAFVGRDSGRRRSSTPGCRSTIPLYILFSSGTTGVPKCIVHGAGGTLLQHLKEHLLHGDLKAGDRLFYFTTCGWMMWNWLVSGLAAGATLLLYDGSPFIDRGKVLWDFADAERITHFGTSAKYIDHAKKIGVVPCKDFALADLRTLFSTGSPLAPESFDYVYQCVKDDLCLSSIAGGTDIVSCFALGCPTLPVWRGELQCRGLGMRVDVYDDAGKPIPAGTHVKGELVCTAPFPSMPVRFWNDPGDAKYRATYFERFPGVWCHGDYVELTAHGGLIFHGRSDATLNPGGVRIGTAEIYRQVEQLPEVVESLVVGQDWPPGEVGDVRVILFVRLKDGIALDRALIDRIKQHVRANTTPRHVPAKVLQVTDIPRTKSNKIVELAVRNVVHGLPVQNLEALANPEALEQFRDREELKT